MRLVTAILHFFQKILGILVTQDFKLEGYIYFCAVPFSPCDIWFKRVRPVLRYRGKKWISNRDKFMIAKHGMTFADTQKPENAHLFVAKLSY